MSNTFTVVALNVAFVAVLVGTTLRVSPPVHVSPQDRRPPSSSEGVEHFEKHIRPLFASQCQSCHGPSKQKGGLRLDQPEFITKGGDTGPILKHGVPTESRIYQAVSYEDDSLKMPPRGKLSAEQIGHIRRWIELGAPTPDKSAQPTHSERHADTFDLRERLKHWCYQPLQPVSAPLVKDATWPLTSIDPFILTKLENLRLKPANDADKRTWLRRVTFDLIGLPPSPGEVDAFVHDDTPQAYAKVVERLLASPHYGERWARHWLDLMRYADTLGHEFDYDLPNAWRYRNYVIRALNDDVPYYQFVLEHLAGDLLPQPRVNQKEQWNESVQGSAFLWLGEAKHGPVDVRQEQADRVDNQIDVIGKAFLGQTLACARCHDHKFDAIATKDYYSLYGVLKSSRYQQACIDLPERQQAAVSKLQNSQQTLRQLLLKEWKEECARFGDYFKAAYQIKESEPKDAAPLDQTKLQRWQKALSDPLLKSKDHPLADFLESLNEGAVLSDARAFRNRFRLEKNGFTDGTIASRNGQLTSSLEFAFDFLSPNQTVRLVPAGSYDSGVAARSGSNATRSDSFEIQQRYLHILAAGQGGRIRVVVDGFQVIRDPIYGGLRKVLNDSELKWHMFDLEMWKGRQAYVECNNGGPLDLSVDAEAKRTTPPWVQLSDMFFSDSKNANEMNADSYISPSHRLTQAAANLRDGMLALLEDCEKKQIKPHKAPNAFYLCKWLIKHQLLPTISPDPAWSSTVDRYKKAEAELRSPRYALATADGNGEDEVVFIRGNHRLPGLKTLRGLSAVYCGPELLQTGTGSGRLELATRLIDPKRNPLLVRVIVNRIWKHHFGEGIVRSVDDFGRMGELPSHPELLDYLAQKFIEQGWSLKQMHREIVLSRTYRQASANQNSMKSDPQNWLLSRMPMRRLEAEAIRDNLLAVSGQLKREATEAGTMPYLTPLMQGRGRPGTSGPLDGDGRRSIYLAVRRNFLSPLLTSFDFPTPFSTMGRRSVSNVPAQGLAMMNDPLVLQQAQAWAKRIVKEQQEVHGRIERMYLEAFARAPTDEERKAASDYLHSQPQPTAWIQLAHVLFCTKEFIFVP